MKNALKRSLSILLAITIIFSSAYAGLGEIDFSGLFAVKVEAASENSATSSIVSDCEVGDIIEFGLYPQNEVTDETFLAELNSLELNWISYGYYTGTGNSYDGQMYSSDYMKYADVTYADTKYRAVIFTQYRPAYTGGLTTEEASYQYGRGYNVNTIYWFKYEPIKWIVLNPQTGLVVSKDLLDSQAFNNTIFYNGKYYYKDTTCTTYANNYSTSSISEWLCTTFYDVSFSNLEKKIIMSSSLGNVFLLSYSEATNSQYGFISNNSRVAKSTDYAMAQGSYASYGWWWLRDADSQTRYVYGVDVDGRCSRGFALSDTGVGVRPAVYLGSYESFNGPKSIDSASKIILNIKDKENGTLIKDTTALINGEEFYIDEGYISIDENSFLDVNTISVQNTSSDFYVQTFKLEYLDDLTETIYLEKKKSDIKPYINYVYYKNTTSGSNWKNAVGESTKILDSSKESFEIVIGATAQIGDVYKFCLAQDGVRTLTNATGVFSNQQLAQVFEPDKDIIAYCIDTSGNVSPAFKTEIKIEKADENFTTVLNNSRIELFSTSGSSFKISNDVPFLGGAEIGLDFASLPISVSVEGSKYKVAIGLDNKTFTKDEWNLYKKALDEIKDMGLNESSSDSEIVNDRQRYKKMQELRKAYGAKAVAGKAVGNGSFDWNILGYVEWEIVNGSPVITDSYIGLTAKAKYSWQTPYVVLGVPCYTELGVGVSASVGGSASRIIADSDIPIEWEIMLSIKPILSLGAGVGCPAFLSLGLEGKGEIEWYQEFLEKYRKIDLTLSASVKAKAFLLSFDKEFATKTWNLWSGTYGTTALNTLSDSAEQYYSSGSVNFLDSDNYNSLADRDYITQTEWIGGYSPTLFSARAISVSGYENSLLQTSIYSDSRQQLVEFDGGKMLVWIMDDTTRESANRTELVYSLYDEATATWAEPVAVFDDGTADFLPDVVSDGENVWVTWQNMNTTFTEDTATMENYSVASEIYVAKYNGETGEFEAAIQVTNDSVVDSIPVITAENGIVSVAWVSNSENDYFGLEGVNSINTASISDGVVSDIETVKTELTSVSSIDCKLADGELYIAYAYDLDNEYNDMSDMEIYQLMVSDGNTTETRITENSVLDSAPRYTELGGKATLVWYSEGNFNVLPNGSDKASTVFTENVGATDIYSVAQSVGDITYIIWSQTVGEQVAFYGAVYDGSEWGEPVLLGEATGKALNPSAVVDSDGTMFVVYNSVVQEEVIETVEDTGEEFTYYTDVQTDLALLKVYQNSNITLSNEGLEIEAESAFPGEIIPLTFNVKNNGTTSVDSIDVYIDGEFNSTVAVALLPGQETSVTIDYTVPETVAETTLSITAEPSSSSDYDSTDNEISVSYGYTELDVDDVTVYSTALKNTITARICNISAVDSGAFTVRIRENDENGAIVCIESFNNLAVGEALFITQEFDKASMVYDEDGVSKYYVEVVADNSEYLIGNNSGLTVFTEENNSGITSELLRESLNDGYVHAYGVIQNNEFASYEVYAKIEILDEAGNVIGLKFKKVSLTDKQTYTLDENVHISGEYYETRLTLLDIGTEDVSLRIPKGVTTINELDFENCSDVVKLIIPESVTSIGTDALSGCDNITVYCFPDSVAETYCEENSIPYVIYQMNPIGETEIDTDNKFIFTSNHLNNSFEDIVTATGYKLVASSISDLLLFGTGATISVFDEEENVGDYTIIVEGDLNGDSVCDVLDAAQAQLYSAGFHEPTQNEIYAANGCISDEIDVNSYQNVVNICLAS